MAMKVKAVERLVKFNKNDAGQYRYVLQPDLYIPLTVSKVIKEASLRSGVSRGVMQACWDAAGEVIKAWATEGHSVAIPGLGTMRFGLRAKSVVDVNEVKSALITSRRIIFTPNVELKDELANTSIQITCINRNGEVVKRVTSTDAGTVEDPEAENTEETGDNSGSENTGENSGSQGGSTQNGGTETGGSETGGDNSGSQSGGDNSGSNTGGDNTGDNGGDPSTGSGQDNGGGGGNDPIEEGDI